LEGLSRNLGLSAAFFMSHTKGLLTVVLVSPTFHPDAVMVELRRHQDGWFVWFVRPNTCDAQFFAKSDVGEDIDARALINEGNVVMYIESCLRAAGYKGVSRRSAAVGVDVAAVWDVGPSDPRSESPG
jgi:hypothetical protein